MEDLEWVKPLSAVPFSPERVPSPLQLVIWLLITSLVTMTRKKVGGAMATVKEVGMEAGSRLPLLLIILTSLFSRLAALLVVEMGKLLSLLVF